MDMSICHLEHGAFYTAEYTEDTECRMLTGQRQRGDFREFLTVHIMYVTQIGLYLLQYCLSC